MGSLRVNKPRDEERKPPPLAFRNPAPRLAGAHGVAGPCAPGVWPRASLAAASTAACAGSRHCHSSRLTPSSRLPGGTQTPRMNDAWPAESPGDRPPAAAVPPGAGAPSLGCESSTPQSTWPGGTLPVTCPRTRVSFSLVTLASNTSLLPFWLPGKTPAQGHHKAQDHSEPAALR